MKKIGEHYGKTISQVALRWVLDNPSVDCAIVGIKNVNQLKENVASTNWRLSAEDFTKLLIQSQIFVSADS